MSRVKEKLDKYVKEKLIEFCDVLDIPISKASAKKVGSGNINLFACMLSANVNVLNRND